MVVYLGGKWGFFSGFLILWILWDSYPLQWRTCLLTEAGCSDFVSMYQLAKYLKASQFLLTSVGVRLDPSGMSSARE